VLKKEDPEPDLKDIISDLGEPKCYGSFGSRKLSSRDLSSFVPPLIAYNLFTFSLPFSLYILLSPHFLPIYFIFFSFFMPPSPYKKKSADTFFEGGGGRALFKGNISLVRKLIRINISTMPAGPDERVLARVLISAPTVALILGPVRCSNHDPWQVRWHGLRLPL
jgi:hypothetical protein